MSMKEWKRLMGLVSICSVCAFLCGCQQTRGKRFDAPVSSVETQSVKTGTDSPIELVMTGGVSSQQLVIHSGCIGCGHCARFAPNNFTMKGRQAQVISQENITSSDVQQAIVGCRASVIEIIEA